MSSGKTTDLTCNETMPAVDESLAKETQRYCFPSSGRISTNGQSNKFVSRSGVKTLIRGGVSPTQMIDLSQMNSFPPGTSGTNCISSVQQRLSGSRTKFVPIKHSVGPFHSDSFVDLSNPNTYALIQQPVVHKSRAHQTLALSPKTYDFCGRRAMKSTQCRKRSNSDYPLKLFETDKNSPIAHHEKGVSDKDSMITMRNAFHHTSPPDTSHHSARFPITANGYKVVQQQTCANNKVTSMEEVDHESGPVCSSSLLVNRSTPPHSNFLLPRCSSQPSSTNASPARAGPSPRPSILRKKGEINYGLSSVARRLILTDSPTKAGGRIKLDTKFDEKNNVFSNRSTSPDFLTLQKNPVKNMENSALNPSDADSPRKRLRKQQFDSNQAPDKIKVEVSLEVDSERGNCPGEKIQVWTNIEKIDDDLSRNTNEKVKKKRGRPRIIGRNKVDKNSQGNLDSATTASEEPLGLKRKRRQKEVEDVDSTNVKTKIENKIASPPLTSSPLSSPPSTLQTINEESASKIFVELLKNMKCESNFVGAKISPMIRIESTRENIDENIELAPEVNDDIEDEGAASSSCESVDSISLRRAKKSISDRKSLIDHSYFPYQTPRNHFERIEQAGFIYRTVKNWNEVRKKQKIRKKRKLEEVASRRARFKALLHTLVNESLNPDHILEASDIRKMKDYDLAEATSSTASSIDQLIQTCPKSIATFFDSDKDKRKKSTSQSQRETRRTKDLTYEKKTSTVLPPTYCSNMAKGKESNSLSIRPKCAHLNDSFVGNSEQIIFSKNSKTESRNASQPQKNFKDNRETEKFSMCTRKRKNECMDTSKRYKRRFLYRLCNELLKVQETETKNEILVTDLLKNFINDIIGESFDNWLENTKVLNTSENSPISSEVEPASQTPSAQQMQSFLLKVPSFSPPKTNSYYENMRSVCFQPSVSFMNKVFKGSPSKEDIDTKTNVEFEYSIRRISKKDRTNSRPKELDYTFKSLERLRPAVCRERVEELIESCTGQPALSFRFDKEWDSPESSLNRSFTQYSDRSSDQNSSIVVQQGVLPQYSYSADPKIPNNLQERIKSLNAEQITKFNVHLRNIREQCATLLQAVRINTHLGNIAVHEFKKFILEDRQLNE